MGDKIGRRLSEEWGRNGACSRIYLQDKVLEGEESLKERQFGVKMSPLHRNIFY